MLSFSFRAIALYANLSLPSHHSLSALIIYSENKSVNVGFPLLEFVVLKSRDQLVIFSILMSKCSVNAYERMGFPGGSDDKESTYNAGDPDSIPGLGRYPREGNGNQYTLQYSYLENPKDRGAWWATVHGVAKSRTPLTNTPLFPQTFSLKC